MKDYKAPKEEKLPQVKEDVPKVIEEKLKQKRKPKVYPRVDMIISNTRIGQQRTIMGPVTGEPVVIIARLDSSYTIVGGEKKLGVDIRDAEKIEDLVVPYRCARTREWCKVKPFVIVT